MTEILFFQMKKVVWSEILVLIILFHSKYSYLGFFFRIQIKIHFKTVIPIAKKRSFYLPHTFPPIFFQKTCVELLFSYSLLHKNTYDLSFLNFVMFWWEAWLSCIVNERWKNVAWHGEIPHLVTEGPANICMLSLSYINL